MGASYFAIRLEHGFQPRIRPPLKGPDPGQEGHGCQFRRLCSKRSPESGWMPFSRRQFLNDWRPFSC